MPLCFFDGVWMCVHACTCSMFNCVQASLLQGHVDIPDFKFKNFQFLWMHICLCLGSLFELGFHPVPVYNCATSKIEVLSDYNFSQECTVSQLLRREGMITEINSFSLQYG